MQKIILTVFLSGFLVFLSAPFFVKAYEGQTIIIPDGYFYCGSAVIQDGSNVYNVSLSCESEVTSVIWQGSSSKRPYNQSSKPIHYYYINQNTGNMVSGTAYTANSLAFFFPCYQSNSSVLNIPIYNNQQDYIDNLPDVLKPSIAELRWDAFYDWYYHKYGYYPVEGSLIDLLRKLALGDDNQSTDITFPTLTPTPTPSPTPTPIPVQTIFVPDGNGNTTIIYQYPDPTTGVITQSPYNPNVTNNITVDCNCDGGSGSGTTFVTSPQDPYSMDASLFWADGFGVQMSESPLAAASDSQESIYAAASEYESSVAVLSNSFNSLPFKWLALIGLCGGILIIAGLIRTFLGG